MNSFNSSNFSYSSVRGFADQRRKLKPNRNHAASRNPVKVLQKRSDVSEEFPDSDEDEDDDIEDGEMISKVFFLSSLQLYKKYPYLHFIIFIKCMSSSI